MANQEDNRVNLGDRVAGEIDLPSIDVTPYVGKKVKIGEVTEHESKKYENFYIRVQTEPVAELEAKDKDGKPIVVRGSRLFGLQQDGDGNIGWGAETKLGLFLKAMKVGHYRDLVGREVILNLQVTKEGQKFLSFEAA